MPAVNVGARLFSLACETEIVVVKAPKGDPTITCGGLSMAPSPPPGADREDRALNAAGGTVLGKRYVNPDGSLEVLCTRAGAGQLSVDGVTLTIKEAKPLPATD